MGKQLYSGGERGKKGGGLVGKRRDGVIGAAEGGRQKGSEVGS